MFPREGSTVFSLICSLALCGATDKPVGMWTAETVGDHALSTTEGRRLTGAELATIRDGKPVVPYRDLTCGVRLSDGTLWVGAKGGLLYRAPQAKCWRLFHSRRWLPDDQVLNLSAAPDDCVYVQTPAGIGRIYQRTTTLEQKMAEIHAELRRRHLREGLVGHINLKQPGRPDAGWVQHDNDNDGLWTSLYVAAEAYRYGVTGDRQAKDNA